MIYLGNWYGSSPCPRGAVFTVRAVHEESGRVSFEWPGVEGACVDLSRVRKVEVAAPVPAPAVTCEHRDAVADHIWGEMVGPAKSVVRDVVAQAFVAAGIEVAIEAEAAQPDPAVYVVRESEVQAQRFTRTASGGFIVAGTELNTSTAEDARDKALRHIDAAARCEAIARAIEAEAQSPDPVEKKARELAQAGGIDFDEQEPDGVDMLMGMALHVLGQETDR